MRKNTFRGILYGASGSLWWGTIGVFYFKATSFAGPIELVVHRTIWTAFSLNKLSPVNEYNVSNPPT